MNNLRLVLIALFLLISVGSYGQQEDKRPFIEVSGKVEREFTPNVAELLITLSEAQNGKGDVTVKEMERALIKAVDKSSINKEALTLDNFATIEHQINRRKSASVSRRVYKLKIEDLSLLDRTITEISKITGITVQLSKFDFSNMDEIKESLYRDAVKVAMNKADVMLTTLGKKRGDAISVHDGYFQNHGAQQRQPMLRSSMKMNSESDSEPSLQIGKSKFTFNMTVKFEIE